MCFFRWFVTCALSCILGVWLAGSETALNSLLVFLGKHTHLKPYGLARILKTYGLWAGMVLAGPLHMMVDGSNAPRILFIFEQLW